MRRILVTLLALTTTLACGDEQPSSRLYENRLQRAEAAAEDRWIQISVPAYTGAVLYRRSA